MEFSVEQKIVSLLMRWYAQNARPLPWRMTADPYRIWVSEIMLQQTRVEAVKKYYARFLEAFPDVERFAQAPEDAYLKLWEGLGYYSRVRNMHACAVEVTERYGGAFPADFGKLLQLPGIGSYTAGAIASIAFGIPVPAVDGNVLRVLSRITADSRPVTDARVRASYEAAVARIEPDRMPGEFNQSLIELGATVCVPNGTPRCAQCPVSALCRAYAAGNPEAFPVKQKKAPRKVRELTVFLVSDGKRILLHRRGNTGLLAGLFEFPNTGGHLDTDGARAYIRTLLPEGTVRLSPAPDALHVFTHVEWHMRGYLVMTTQASLPEGDYVFATPEELTENYALPSAFAAYKRCIR